MLRLCRRWLRGSAASHNAARRPTRGCLDGYVDVRVDRSCNRKLFSLRRLLRRLGRLGLLLQRRDRIALRLHENVAVMLPQVAADMPGPRRNDC